jgi:hypothetical protein
LPSGVVAEDVHRPQHFHARRIHRHEDLRVLLMAGSIGVRERHADQDLAAMVTRAGNVGLFAIDDPLAVFEHGRRRDVGGVR